MDGRAEGTGFERRPPGDDVDQRLVAAMAVDDQDFLETVVGDALSDVQAESDEYLGLDVDRPGEVDVMEVEPIGDGGEDEHALGVTPPQFQTDRLG